MPTQKTSINATNSTPSLSRRAWAIVKFSRIPGWTFGPILFGIGLIHSEVLPKSMPALAKAALQMSALSFPLCAIVFGVNDVYDYESDLRNPRKKAEGMEGGILNPVFHKDVLTAAYWSSAIVMTAAMVCGEPQNVLANAVLVTLGWQYSSPPFRLKEIPVVDSISNGLIVFLAWFIGFSFSGRSIAEAPAKGYMMSLCTAGVHALGAVMDTEADRAAGQKTIAVVLGKRCAAIFAAMC
ncbi:UbiA prenyltransferase family [Sparassis latifolia]